MKKNILKKVIVLFSFVFLFTGHSFVFALTNDTTPLADTTPTVALPVLNSIAITTPATKLSYIVGDSLDIGGLVITGTYDSGPTQIETITSSDITGFDSSKVVSNQILTVTVGGKTVTYTVNILPAPVAINLEVYAGDTVLFSGSEKVTACAESPATDAPTTVNGKCAIEQSKLSNTWTWKYSPSGWLDELGGYTTTSDFSKYWSWFNNLSLGGTGLNQHHLSDGENLLLTYNSYPLRILASKNSGQVGDTITFTAEEESTFDSNYNLIWTKSTGVLITLGAQSCTTVTDGTCSIILNTAGSLNAVGSKSLYVPPASIRIEVSNKVVSSNSGGGEISPTQTFSIANAINFLQKNQKSDGSYDSSMYTDWVAIGAVAEGNSNLESSISNYLKANSFDSSLLTDNERHAMALMSLGISPYTGTNVDYIKKITDSFDGTQFGDKTLNNDDIFALIVLKNAGYGVSDEIIQKDINYIISQQTSNGSWGSIDITAAAIQALTGLESANGVTGAISKGESYLISIQGTDNGFGNSFSTSWVLQSMPNNSQISKAEDYLTSKQQTDGGLEDTNTDDVDTRVWSTAYAIPAILHKPWSQILNNFSKPVVINNPLPKVSEEPVKEVVVGEVKVPEDTKVITKNPTEDKKDTKVENLKVIEKKTNLKNRKIKSKTSHNHVVLDLKTTNNFSTLNNSLEVKHTNTSTFKHIWKIIESPFNWLLTKLGF